MSKPGCPFCRSNNKLQLDTVASTPDAYVIPSLDRADHYLIIPEDHYEALDELPDTWWQDVKILLDKLPRFEDYNLSINIGEQAGQRLKHLHFWLIPRTAGKPSSTKGMALLIAEADDETN